jgi:Ca2+-binding RTX toxin-like protein
MADTIAGNTSTLQTLQVGATASSAIDFFGDTDWWRVSLANGFQYQVWVEGVSAGLGTLGDPYLAVYNAFGNFLFSNDDADFFTSDAFSYIAPSSGGTFYLSAEEFGNNGVGSYSITLWRDELPSAGSAASIPVNGSAEGIIGWRGDTSDWWGVSLVAGVTYQFDLIGADGDGALSGLSLADPWLALRGPQGASLVVDDDAGLGLNARIYFTPTASGTYFLDVQESGVDDFGSYRLLVNASPLSSAIVLNTASSGNIDHPGDMDLYSLELTAGAAYTFTVDAGSLNDPLLEVLDANGAVIAFDDDSGAGLNAMLEFTPISTGTHYLAARASGHGGTGSYVARVGLLPSVSIGTASVTEGNSGSTALTFTLSLSFASGTPIEVTAQTSGTATATFSDDYVPASTTVRFAAHQTTASFTVMVQADTLFEPLETFHVRLSDPVGARLGTANAVGAILDDDSPHTLPSDIYLPAQWYLYPGSGIDVFPVWPDYTGAGVRIAVLDQGIDASHPDLDGNLLTGLGRNASNLGPGGAPLFPGDNHGTAVAGTIAAERDGSGIVGVAYGAKLVSIYSPLLLDGLAAQITNAYHYAASVDVLNDSWGFANGFASGATWAFYDNFQSPGFAAAGSALANLAATGRGGLGTVVVQSAGNSLGVGDDTNLHNFQNSQYIITVAATDYAGEVTSYSSPGASILVAAPGGGGSDVLSDILTTDRVGAAGNDSGDYTTIAGTSFSSPIVAGVVALMLEANPGLGYRDIQEILAYSARKTAPDTNSWLYNGASNWNGGGLHIDAYDHNLGFGMVDARAAVRLAESWSTPAHTAANRQIISYHRNPAALIPDNSNTGAFDSIDVTESIDIERVEVSLDVTHPYVGDLSVLLISPGGTGSFLLWRPQQNPLSAYGTSQNNIHFTFSTVLNWGESSRGVWALAVLDSAAGDVGQLDGWTLRLIGKPDSQDDRYVFTDEFSEAAAEEATRTHLSDDSGVDTINAAATTRPVMLDLASAAAGSIDGRALSLAAGTTIEHATGGDANDTVSGNAADNALKGMRGSDLLRGMDGADSLSGGGGSDTLDGGNGNDVLDGGAGNDEASGGAGFDMLLGGPGHDLLRGGEQADNVIGGDGDDTLSGGKGTDSLDGGAGNDTLIGALGTDLLAGGDGTDTADYSTSPDGVSVNLLLTTAQLVSLATGLDTLLQIENLIGSALADTLTGTTGNNSLVGRSGDDTLAGESGFDFLDGGDGNDSLAGGLNADTLHGGAGSDFLGGGQGTDSLVGGDGNDTLVGGLGTDFLLGGAGSDHFVFRHALDGKVNIDTFGDLETGLDVVELSASIFVALAPSVGMRLGIGAHLVYNGSTGTLAYDADGAGAGLPVTFAVVGVGAHPATIGQDFLVVS